MNERKIKKWRKSFKGISEETRLLVNDALKECYSNSEAELSWELEVRGVVLDEESMSKLSLAVLGAGVGCPHYYL